MSTTSARGVGSLGQVPDGVEDRAAADLDAFHGVEEAAAQRGLGVVVGHEGQKRHPRVGWSRSGAARGVRKAGLKAVL